MWRAADGQVKLRITWRHARAAAVSNGDFERPREAARMIERDE